MNANHLRPCLPRWRSQKRRCLATPAAAVLLLVVCLCLRRFCHCPPRMRGKSEVCLSLQERRLRIPPVPAPGNLPVPPPLLPVSCKDEMQSRNLPEPPKILPADFAGAHSPGSLPVPPPLLPLSAKDAGQSRNLPEPPKRTPADAATSVLVVVCLYLRHCCLFPARIEGQSQISPEPPRRLPTDSTSARSPGSLPVPPPLLPLSAKQVPATTNCAQVPAPINVAKGPESSISPAAKQSSRCP